MILNWISSQKTATMVRIAKPNSTPQTDLYWVLNLACLKHTGQCLPQDLLPANTWKYGADKKAKLFIPRLSPCFFNDLTLQIKRSLVVDQLNSIFNHAKEKKEHKRLLHTFQSSIRNENCLFAKGSIKPEYFNHTLVRKLDERTQLFRAQSIEYLRRNNEHHKIMEIISYHLIQNDVIGHELIAFIKDLTWLFNKQSPETPKAVFEYKRHGAPRTIPVMSYVFKRPDYDYAGNNLPSSLQSGYSDFRWGVTMPKEYSLAEDTNAIIRYHKHYPRGIWFHKRNTSPVFYKNQNKHLTHSNEYEYFKYLFCGITKNLTTSYNAGGNAIGFYDQIGRTDYWTRDQIKNYWNHFKSGNKLSIEESMRIFAGVRPQPTHPWEEGSVVQVC